MKTAKSTVVSSFNIYSLRERLIQNAFKYKDCTQEYIYEEFTMHYKIWLQIHFFIYRIYFFFVQTVALYSGIRIASWI